MTKGTNFVIKDKVPDMMDESFHAFSTVILGRSAVLGFLEPANLPQES
jgi:hypothetical protein